MTQMPELKPCPFCGGKAVFKIIEHERPSQSAVGFHYEIECDGCGTTNNQSGITVFLLAPSGDLRTIQDDRQKVADGWNRRGKYER